MTQFFTSLIWKYLLEYKPFNPVILHLRIHPGRRGKIMFRNKPHTCLRYSQRSNILCAPGPRDPTETEPELCLGVSCGGTGQQ